MISLSVLMITTFPLLFWFCHYFFIDSAFKRKIFSCSGPDGFERPPPQKKKTKKKKTGVVKGYCSLYFMLQEENVGSDQLQRTMLYSVKKKKKQTRVLVYMYT